MQVHEYPVRPRAYNTDFDVIIDLGGETVQLAQNPSDVVCWTSFRRDPGLASPGTPSLVHCLGYSISGGTTCFRIAHLSSTFPLRFVHKSSVNDGEVKKRGGVNTFVFST